ncbi:hypothetical protein AHF37_01757 [Paragonimus kellicotti]|nr:hypothetical protein AHF37_01757 [Paragonimus kellicotti]
MRRTVFICGMMVMVAVIYLIGMCMEGFFFGVVGERLTRRLRDQLFCSIVHQEISWFDRPENQPGVLTSRLATEATAVRNVSGFQLAILLEALALLVSSFVIGFIDSWQITLLLLAFLPFLLLGGYMEYRALFDQDSEGGKKSQRAQIAQEAFSACRTVTTFGLEEYFSGKFNATLEVDKNQTHALVGQSGCGKSTVLQLVLRFYDVLNSGRGSGIFVNGISVTELAPRWLRQQIGLVSQEPNLFNMTIRENIAYGANFRDVTMNEIIEAAKQANIHDFILTLPENNLSQPLLMKTPRKSVKSVIIFSLLHALSRSVNYLAYAAAFPLGAYLIGQNQVDSFRVFRSFSAITFGLSSAGRVVAFIPDMRKASIAANNIIRTLDRKSNIPLDEGHKPDTPFDGRVEFRNVSFRYPTRLQNPVLKVRYAYTMSGFY